ncbi:hypothetical protein MMC11_000319 [Xylographa trunciseda]|nr:hypothetical protein [Xylographa trunciseda]
MYPEDDLSSDLTTWTLGNPVVEDNRPIYVDAQNSDQRFTKYNVVTLVRILVAGFRHENRNKYLNGKTVCVHSFNSVCIFSTLSLDEYLTAFKILYPVLFHGIIAAGGCFTGTNPAYTSEELAHHFRVSRTKVILTEVEHLEYVMPAAIRCGISHSHIFVLHSGNQRPSPSHRSWTELLQHGQSDWVAIHDIRILSKTPAALFSTSGTSGLPKIAVRSHRSLVEECIRIHDDNAKPYVESRLICLPMFHAFASPLANISALRYGVKTFIMPRFHEKTFLETISRFGITETAVVPPIFVKFLSESVEARRKQLQSLCIVWCAGAPLNRELQQGLKSNLLSHDARIVQVYGLTECGWVSTFKHPESDETGSVGRLLPGYQAKIVHDDGGEVYSAYASGEVLLKAPSMMSGYLENPSATTAAFDVEGWYRTGDVARIEGRKMYIVDRKKEMIKVRGWQVAPAELEGVLLKHQYIVDAAVIGVKLHDDDLHEFPEAYVVCRPGVTLKMQEVTDFMLQYLARYKVNNCRIIICESIPKSASGKILKRRLREQRHIRQSWTPMLQAVGIYLWVFSALVALFVRIRTLLIGRQYLSRA